jgi:hypothetical protein
VPSSCPAGQAQPRRQLDAWQEWAKQRGARGLAYVLIGEDGAVDERGPVVKNLSESERSGLAAAVGAQPGDCIFFAAGRPNDARALLGAARGEIAPRRGSSTSRRGRSSGSSTPRCSSRRPRPTTSPSAAGSGPPCTTRSPRPTPSGSTPSGPTRAARSAYAYDIVCNGNEIGGGSIRIHRADVQKRVFEIMGLGEEEAQEKFGFLLDAFAYGPPAARRHRLRLGPDHRAPRGRGLDPGGHRVPEDRRRLRPADGGARPDHAGAAQGGRGRRGAAAARRRAGDVGGRHRRGLTVQHLRVITPARHTAAVRDLLLAEPGATHVTVHPGVALQPAGDVVEADITREAVDDLFGRLSALGVDHTGGVTLEAIDTTLSDSADRAEEAVPGDPMDAVVWDEVVARTARSPGCRPRSGCSSRSPACWPPSGRSPTRRSPSSGRA